MNNKEQMLNAWSLLYDEMEHSEYYYEYDRNDSNRKAPEVVKCDGYSHSITTSTKSDYQDFWENSNPYTKTINFNMDKPHFWKYSEDAILAELKEYISSTYRQHYSAGNDKIQTLDLIEACGDGEAFCRSNILKYASRYDKKGTARRDIIKILHYAVLLLHFSDKSAPPTETYNQ